MSRRVVITGLGMLTPLGIGVEPTWESLCEGRSGIGRITKFDPAEFASRIAGEVKEFDPSLFIEKKEMKKMDRFIHFAMSSCKMAVEDSEIEIDEANADRTGVVVGVGLGGLPAIEKYHIKVQQNGPRKITPFFIPMLIGNLAAGQISIKYGAKGPNLCVQTACASGSHAIGDAYRLICHNKADIMIAGGTESVITPLGIGGFCAMRALSTSNDDPEKASRPFDNKRDGFVMGEGAGIIIMEELNRAKKRGAKIYGEIIGYGMSADAYHITSPSPDGEGAARCMQMALEDAKISKEDIDYINAHGTSTPYGDELETAAIKTAFKDYAYKLAISSTKSMTGHLLGASGGVEAIISLLVIKEGIIPPTINYKNPDPECDLDYVPNAAREKEIDCVISNSFGFGGTNASLIFRRFRG